jgi:uncharacterized membrane protein
VTSRLQKLQPIHVSGRAICHLEHRPPVTRIRETGGRIGPEDALSHSGHGMAPPSDRPATESVSRTMEENVRFITSWEQSALHARSRAERLSEWVTSTAGRGWALFAHLLLFGVWTTVNLGAIPGVRPFDPFPFPLLTTMMSLEAIVLALFVLSSQNRLATQADKRAHLNLQIDLLAEREMTAVLQLLQDIAGHLGVAHAVGSPRIDELAKETDVHALASKLDDALPSRDEKGGATATREPRLDGAAGSARSSS